MNPISKAVDLVRRRLSSSPEIVLVLGSGLGVLAESAMNQTVIPALEIPGYPASTVAGHEGRLVFGRLEDRGVLFIQGRVHRYEGQALEAVTFPIRLAAALGASKLVVTNAAGGINPAFGPGSLMFITGHLNFSFSGPLPVQQDFPHPIGQSGLPGSPHRGATPPYDPAWIDRAERFGLENGIQTYRGVYVWASGPSYETRAEIRMFSRMGADAVGMSTVPEVIQASALGMRVIGVSTITNPAAGLGTEPLAHDDVLAVGRQARRRLEVLLQGIVATA